MKPSRAMISGELFVAYVALCYAWAGSGAWPLHAVPAASAHPMLLALLLGIPALALMAIAATEWVAHDVDQPDSWLERLALRFWRGDLQSADLRGKLCLTLLAGWLYMAKLTLSSSPGANASSLIAIGGVAFCLAFYLENRRVQREIRSQIAAAFDLDDVDDAHPAH